MGDTGSVKTGGILKAYAFNLDYAKTLVADLDDVQMCASAGAGLENHPAWTIGHLCTGSALAASCLKLPKDLPAGWEDIFERRGPSDRRRPDQRADYPTRIKLVAELTRQHERVHAALHDADESLLAEPKEWKLDQWMPSTLDIVSFLCVGHEMMHLGQLAAWRRAKGLPPAMAGM